MVDINDTNALYPEYTIEDRLFLSEIKWYDSIASDISMPNQILKVIFFNYKHFFDFNKLFFRCF